MLLLPRSGYVKYCSQGRFDKQSWDMEEIVETDQQRFPGTRRQDIVDSLPDIEKGLVLDYAMNAFRFALKDQVGDSFGEFNLIQVMKMLAEDVNYKVPCEEEQKGPEVDEAD